MLHDSLTPPIWPSSGPSSGNDRFARTIRTDHHKGCRIALIGLPDDLGIRLNNGRTGAAAGPAAFRAALARYGTPFDADNKRELPIIFDAGDVAPIAGADHNALNETHRRITDALQAVHRAGMIPICIGGGHDLTFPSVRALALHNASAVGGVSIDPHLDVRETIGSGMPFRSLIEASHLEPARFSVLGIGRFTNSRAHTEWLGSRGGAITTIASLRADPLAALRTALNRAGRDSFLTFDLDAIDAAAAPGVSAINPAGLSPHDAAAICEAAGADPRIRHFDIMELSPPHDPDGRTARIAALLFLSFLAGFARRDQSHHAGATP